MPKPLSSGGDARTDWRTTNQIIAQVDELTRRLAAFTTPQRSIYGSGSLQTMRVQSAAADYLICHIWDGTTEGTEDIKVAKNFESRQPASEILAGTTYYYAYVAGPDGNNDYRNVTGGSTIQQIVVPLWVVDGLILVARTNYSGVDDGSGNDLKLIEVSARCWAGPTSV